MLLDRAGTALERAETAHAWRAVGAVRLTPGVWLAVCGCVRSDECGVESIHARGERVHQPDLLALYPGVQCRQDRGGYEVMSPTTESITETARAFFDACETGQGWAACSAYCQPDASFSAQAE